MSYHFQPLALFLIDVEMKTKLNIQKQDMFLIAALFLYLIKSFWLFKML